MRANTSENFFAKISKDGPLILKTRCWVWFGSKDSDGYGAFWIANKKWRTHRFSYQFHFSSIPKGQCVCHRCDNPCCVNPSHLFIGTFSDNNRDRMKKGRNRDQRGERHNMVKLTESQVLEIRSRPYYRGITYALAKEFGVKPTTICLIRHGKIWKHL